MPRLVFRMGLMLSLLLAAAGLAWGTGSIKVMSSGGTNYLVTAKGMTLYYFAKDASGKSACVGRCAKFWPPYHASQLSVPAGLTGSDFGAITRPDGKMQTTYDGWPLYTFAGDRTAGQTKGEGFRGVWFVASVPFYTVAEANSSKAGGSYLVDARGKSLYYFTKDSADKSVCAGRCAKLWPPFDVSNFVLPSTLKASNFSTITRANGNQQVVYKGHPLYYFAGDHTRGAMVGQGFKKIWYLVDPSKLTALQAAPKGSSW